MTAAEEQAIEATPMDCALSNARRLLDAGGFQPGELSDTSRAALVMLSVHDPGVVAATIKLMGAVRGAEIDIEAGVRAGRPILDAAGLTESALEVRSPAARKALAVMARLDPDVLVGILDLFTAARDAEAARCPCLGGVSCST